MENNEADIAVITILEEEYEAVLEALGSTTRDPGRSESPNTHAWRMGYIPASSHQGMYRVVVAFAGRPGPNAGNVAVTRTIGRWHPRHVLLVGIAGGLPIEDLKKGDVVVSTVIWDYEYGKAEQVFIPRHDFTYQVDGSLVRNALACALTSDWWKGLNADPDGQCHPKVIAGPIASGSKVIDEITEEFFGQVQRAWPKLQAIEMEGAGAAAAIQSAQEEGRSVGFLMVRGISDMPDYGRPHSAAQNSAIRGRWKEHAATVAARFAVSLIATNWPYPAELHSGGHVAQTSRNEGSNVVRANDVFDSKLSLREALGLIHLHLLSQPGNRDKLEQLLKVLSPICRGGAELATQALNSLQANGFLITAPGDRYELSPKALNTIARR
ncbi:MAG: hypothetical protein AB1631_07775 [Acidobacteriota bacterium]